MGKPLPAQSDSGSSACERADPTSRADGGGAGPGGGPTQGGRPGPGKTEAPNLGVAAEPDSGVPRFPEPDIGRRRARKPGARKLALTQGLGTQPPVGRAPGEERPQTESSEFLRPRLAGSRASVLLAALLVASGVSAPDAQRLHRPTSSQAPQRLPVVLVLQRQCSPRRPCSPPRPGSAGPAV